MSQGNVKRALALAAATIALLAGCGNSNEHLSYQQRIRKLEVLLARCGNEPSDAGYRRCIRQTEGTVRSYVKHLCPHRGGYTFEGVHKPCPSHPIKKLLVIR
jgi:hypothetical protein